MKAKQKVKGSKAATKRAPRKQGRRRKLSPTVVDLICDALKSSAYDHVAARAAGVSKASFYKWKAIGEEQRELPVRKRDPDMKDYVDFLDRIEVAAAQGEVTLTIEARVKNPLGVLGRRFRERWSEETTHNLKGTGKDGAIPIEVIDSLLEVLDDEEKTKNGNGRNGGQE